MFEKYFGLVHLLILLVFFAVIEGILLLLILRLAAWLNKKFTPRAGQRVSIAGATTGALVSLFATTLLGFPLIIYVEIEGSGALTSAIDSSGWFFRLQLVVGFASSAFGGYVAAWMARHDELLNGLLSSLLSVAISLYSILLGKNAQSLLMQILLLVSAPAFAVVGGYLKQAQKRMNRPPKVVDHSLEN